MRQSSSLLTQAGETHIIEGPTGTFRFYTEAEWAALPKPLSNREVDAEEFRRLFTDAEMGAMWLSTDPIVGVFVIKICTRLTPISKDDPQIIGGLAYLSGQTIPIDGVNRTIATPLLASGRMTQILA